MEKTEKSKWNKRAWNITILGMFLSFIFGFGANIGISSIFLLATITGVALLFSVKELDIHEPKNVLSAMTCIALSSISLVAVITRNDDFMLGWFLVFVFLATRE